MDRRREPVRGRRASSAGRRTAGRRGGTSRASRRIAAALLRAQRGPRLRPDARVRGRRRRESSSRSTAERAGSAPRQGKPDALSSSSRLPRRARRLGRGPRRRLAHDGRRRELDGARSGNPELGGAPRNGHVAPLRRRAERLARGASTRSLAHARRRRDVGARSRSPSRRSRTHPPDLFGCAWADASQGWVVGEFGTVLRTADGGDTWTLADAGTRDAFLTGVAFVGADGWIVGFLPNSVARSFVSGTRRRRGDVVRSSARWTAKSCARFRCSTRTRAGRSATACGREPQRMLRRASAGLVRETDRPDELVERSPRVFGSGP